MELDNNAEFVKLYKKLERVKDTDPETFNYYENKYEIITSFRNMRNVLCHVDNPGQVSDTFLNELRTFVNKLTTTVTDIYVPISKIQSAKLNDELCEIVALMSENNYSFVPILDEEKRLLGVISENDILNLSLKNSGILNDDEIIVSDYLNSFGLDTDSNYFFEFVNRQEMATSIKTIFSSFRNNKICGMVFVTEHGKQSEKILGFVSPWDVINL